MYNPGSIVVDFAKYDNLLDLAEVCEEHFHLLPERVQYYVRIFQAQRIGNYRSPIEWGGEIVFDGE